MSLAPYLFNSNLGYTRSLAGGSQKLLRNCLMEIHKDVVTCWNFKGKVLNYGRSRLSLLDLRPRRQILYGEEFMQLMLYLVQDVVNGNQPQDAAYVLTHSTQRVLTPPSSQKISQFVDLVTAPAALILPPVAVLDFTSQFIQWLSTTVLINECAILLNHAI